MNGKTLMQWTYLECRAQINLFTIDDSKSLPLAFIGGGSINHVHHLSGWIDEKINLISIVKGSFYCSIACM